MINHKQFSKAMFLPGLRWFAIAGILLLFWFVIGFLYTSFGSYFIVTDNYNANIYQKIPKGKLLKGQTLSGEFTAGENNLGIVSLRLLPGNNSHSEEDDYFVFKLKEKSASDWYYVKTYKSGYVRGFTYFPIGFPSITNSKGKTYQFRIISLRGNNLNAITVVKTSPVLVTKYQFSKTDLLHGRENILHFLFKKIGNFLFDPNMLSSSSIFSLPFIFFVSWTLFIKYTLLRKKIFLVFALFLIFAQLLLYSSMVYGIILALLMIWILAVYRNKLSSDFTFLLALCIFFIGELFIFLRVPIGETESAFWVYLLLIMGVVQLVWEINTKPINLKTIDTIQNIFMTNKRERSRKKE